MTRKASRAFDQTRRQLLTDPQVAAAYLEEVLASGDMAVFKEALKDVAIARKEALKDVAIARVGNMTELARETHLARESLYHALSRRGNPRLDTLTKVLHATGLRLSIAPAAA